MKTMLKKIVVLLSFALFLAVGCTDKFDEINEDPNNPISVETGYILTYAQKSLIDNMRDAWFAGRGTQLLCQHWSQRNYPDEDRFLIRTTTINNAWRAFYRVGTNLQHIIDLNTNDATKNAALASGPNEHQIAVARILKAYVMSIITDTWGDVPYSEAFKGANVRQPAFDAQADIYADLIKELTEAAAQIDPANGNLTKGDVIYGGDVAKWKKFANSLRLRLALRMSAKNPAPLAAVAALPATSFFESNDDNAKFTYLTASPNEGPVFRAFFIDARNDFTMAKPFMDLLSGVNDTLNAKPNPFVGIEDPRLSIFAHQVGGKWVGMPYGMDDPQTKAFAPNCPDYVNDPSPVHQPDFAYTLMDYAEVCFILSEVNSWNQTWYEDGIRASMEDWGVPNTVADPQIDDYIASVPAASQENVLTQKYIALYMQPEQAWFEWRRTTYPHTLIKPGEITHQSGGVDIIFQSLVDGVTDIPYRMWYPVEEQGVNKANYLEAVEAQGVDELTTKMWLIDL